MENVLNVAKVLYEMFYDQTGTCMDEMKMHKLLYFSQRESLMKNKELLFNGKFYGWKYGPVSLDVRSEYKTGKCFSDSNNEVSESTATLLKDVFERYGNLSSWKLSSLTHEELSWKNARRGLAANDNGNVVLSTEAMMVDAFRESMRRKYESDN